MKNGTKFVVLSSPSPGTWTEVVTVEAPTKDAALRSVGGVAGEYVAVPLRSWQPVRLEVETVEKIRVFSTGLAAEKAEA